MFKQTVSIGEYNKSEIKLFFDSMLIGLQRVLCEDKKTTIYELTGNELSHLLVWGKFIAHLFWHILFQS